MRTSLFILLLASVQLVFAQDQVAIKKDFETIILKTTQNKVIEVLDMTYPRLFELMPKAQMASMAKGMMDGMGTKSIVEEIPLNLKMSVIKKLSSGSICLCSYNQSIRMEFEKHDMVELMLQAKMKDNVVEKINSNAVRIKGKGYLLAIKDAYTKNSWKYLKYDEDNEALSDRVLSKEIINKIAELKKEL